MSIDWEAEIAKLGGGVKVRVELVNGEVVDGLVRHGFEFDKRIRLMTIPEAERVVIPWSSVVIVTVIDESIERSNG